MNLEMAKQLSWYGGMLAAIIGLILLILQVTRGDKQPPEDSAEHANQRKFLGMVWSAFIPTAIILFIFIGFTPEKTGIRGALASILIGFIIPLFLASLDSQAIKKMRGKKTIPMLTFSSLPLAGMGISMLYIGFVTGFYGIHADNLWLCFIIGISLSLFLLRLTSGMIKYSKYRLISDKMEPIFFIIIIIIIATIMAGHHFGHSTIKTFLPTLILMGLFITLLLVTVPFSLKPAKKLMDILPGQMAVFFAVFLGICLFLVLKLNLKFDYNYPIIAGAITSVIFIVIIYGSASSIKGVDLSSGIMGSLILAGGLWSAYKWGLGYGMTLYTIGLVAVASILVVHKSFESQILSSGAKTKPEIPAGDDPLLEGPEGVNSNIEKANENSRQKDSSTSREDNNGDSDCQETIEDIHNKDFEKEPTWAWVFLRSITLASFTAILYCLFKVFVQKSPLLNRGLDISYADVAIALFLGVLTPLAFEGFNLMGGNKFKNFWKGNIRSGIILFLGGIGITVLLLLVVGILFKMEGVGAFILGMVISALLGNFAYFAQKKDDGIFRASLCSIWIGAAAFTNFLLKYKDIPSQLTRAHKQQIVVGIVLLVIVIYFYAHYQNRRKPESEKEEIEEKDLEVKSIT